tara:strand:- start:205 stop:705 length:501 start_codon:yes stop_codon:yes gene_type:complete
VKTGSAYTNYQELAGEFAVGDTVVPFGHDQSAEGTIVALYPAIGMADVQTSQGAKRFPVEEIRKIKPSQAVSEPIKTDSVPGGAGTVPKVASPSRVALYWKNKDRQYHATKEECGSGVFSCPKCKAEKLRKAIYKRRGGASDHLLACPNCMFLIKDLDIHIHGGGH